MQPEGTTYELDGQQRIPKFEKKKPRRLELDKLLDRPNLMTIQKRYIGSRTFCATFSKPYNIIIQEQSTERILSCRTGQRSHEPHTHTPRLGAAGSGQGASAAANAAASPWRADNAPCPVRGARPAQPAAAARFPRRPGPASEPTARSWPPCPTAPARPRRHHGKGTWKGQRTARGAGEGSSPRARGEVTRPGSSSPAGRHLRGPGSPDERFAFGQRRSGAASLRPTRRNRAGGGAQSAPASATAAILAATPPGARGAVLGGGIQTDTHRYLVTSARPGPSALRAPRPTQAAGRLRIPRATAGALGERAGCEETPTPSVHCARDGWRPRGRRQCLLGVVVFPTGPRPAPPRPMRDWGASAAVLRTVGNRGAYFSYKIKYENSDELCKCFCLVGRRVKSRRNPKRGQGSDLALVWSSIDYSVPVGLWRVLLLDLWHGVYASRFFVLSFGRKNITRGFGV
ncbi:cuticle collagen dpy-13-like [Corvus hawaiiensis]|uniref:cuticle collagen dpy-13-like n=1 Tax=Corvus hawaiiensis TaxID=134902 RepID=UPI00201874A7|nr:cuticle collagen dpy-13-like [Corvus hawaiiensis]